ncbi:MAG: hypothetical protein Q8N45_02515, partial [Anaerolineales bacterium]|nr:hypothetical protein [Anaerolineales bacterium]
LTSPTRRAAGWWVVSQFIQCEITGGAPSESIETSGAAFFREGEIPELSLARVTPLQITRMFEHYRHPEWPTDFD